MYICIISVMLVYVILLTFTCKINMPKTLGIFMLIASIPFDRHLTNCLHLFCLETFFCERLYIYFTNRRMEDEFMC